MAQRVKETIRQDIIDAALMLFAKNGFGRTTVSQIAAEAGISSGNIYHYFKNKKEIFNTVLPDEFAVDIERIIVSKISSIFGIMHIDELGEEHVYFVKTVEFIDFIAENRLRIIVLLSGSEGTHFGNYAEQLTGKLAKLAAEHFESAFPGTKMDKIKKFQLAIIYRNAIQAINEALIHYKDKKKIKEAVNQYMKYHVAGLHGLFDPDFELWKA